MSERSIPTHPAAPQRRRGALARVAGVLLLAATAAACDKCGDFVPPFRLSADPPIDACRDEAPKLR